MPPARRQASARSTHRITKSDLWCEYDPEQVVTFYSSKVAELQESMPELLTSAQVLSQEEPEDESTSPAQQVHDNPAFRPYSCCQGMNSI